MSDGKKLIAAIVLSGSVETLRQINVEILEDDEVPYYEFVKNHFRRYSQLPIMRTVEEEVGRLPSAPENVNYYLKRVYDRKLFQSLREQYGELRDAMRDFNIDAAKEIIDRMKASCRTDSPAEDLRTLYEAAQDVMLSYDDAHHRPGLTGIPTGWSRFDETIGGYQPGDLISYVARLGVGKTYNLLKQSNFAWHAGYSVLVVTMEMTIEQIVRRSVGMQAKINPDYIRKGTLDSFSARRLRRYIDNMTGSDRFHIYAGSFSKSVSDIDILINELTPDIVYVDGAYLLYPDMHGSKRRMSRQESVPLVFDDLKKMTITTSRPIVTTSQFSREAGKRGKDGSIETIGFTDAIGQHSSIVVGVRDGTPPFQHTRRVLELLKGREGERGEFEVNYKFNGMNFDEIPPEQEAMEEGNVDWMADQEETPEE